MCFLISIATPNCYWNFFALILKSNVTKSLPFSATQKLFFLRHSKLITNTLFITALNVTHGITWILMFSLVPFPLSNPIGKSIRSGECIGYSISAHFQINSFPKICLSNYIVDPFVWVRTPSCQNHIVISCLTGDAKNSGSFLGIAF